MSTVILAQNEKDTLPTDVAVSDLHDTLTAATPDLVVLNEWNRNRDRATRKMTKELGYGYKRPLRGGGPVLWRLDGYEPLSIRSRMIAPPGYMGRLPGRRSFLGFSWCTVAVFRSVTGKKVSVDGFHMTAEIQDVRGGGGYKTDAQYARRVKRHKREKRGVGKIGRAQLAAGIEAHPVGDSNFDGMTLGGFVNCWDGHSGGDLGGRAVTIVFAARRPTSAPRTYKTHSDHLAVAVRYP